MKVLHLFCGIGGGALGFQRAGFDSVGAFDFDAAACRDFERLVGSPATVADLAALEPADLRRACADRPDVVFTSPPCKGFSGCLPAARSATPHYQAMNGLALRGVWLALEAWPTPPPLLVLENVPRILNRGAAFLEQAEALLHAYGYAVAKTVHDCGELGGLAQHRRRFLLVARHMEQVPELVYQPPRQRVRAIGEVLGDLPVPIPGGTEGGPMHELPRLSALNWVRLALIPAGGDWRDLPAAVALPHRDARQNGPFGVEDWNEAAHSIVGHADLRSARAAVADPRVGCQRRDGGHGVRGWDQPSAAIIGHATIDNFPVQVADPRLGCTPLQSGLYGVQDWASPSHTVRAHFNINGSPAAVADPRVPEIVGPPVDVTDRTPTHLVIRAADGTWHRPMTTLELAALQGFPVRLGDAWLNLDGSSQRSKRERIGNAVPPAAAEAIGRAVGAALAAGRDAGFRLDSRDIWVRRPAEVRS